jgi:hypothetical protein
MTDIGFAPNYTHLYEVDITPDADTPTWARVGAGINKIEPDGNEDVDQSSYYDCDGGKDSQVTGGQMVISVTGHRCYGDPFQDWCASVQLSYGAARRTKMRMTNPDGEVVEANVTVANIKAFGANGEATDKGDFECELQFNGSPTIIEPTGDMLPETVSAQDVSVAVGETATVSPTVTPSAASQRCVFAVADDSIATVSSDGVVTGVKEGETKLSVKAAAKPSAVAVVAVTVTAV